MAKSRKKDISLLFLLLTKKSKNNKHPLKKENCKNYYVISSKNYGTEIAV